MKMKKMENRIRYCILILACAITISTQMLEYYHQIRFAMFVLWGIFFVISIKRTRWKMQCSFFFRIFAICYFFYVTYSIVLYLFLGTHFKESAFLELLYIPLLMYWVGLSIGDESSEVLNWIILAVAISSIMLALYLNKRYMISWSSWMQNSTYLYSAKNSAGQIFAVSGICILFCRERRSKVQSICYLVIAAFLFAECALFQCRTAMLGVAAAFTVYLVVRPGNLKRKVFFVIGAVLVLGAVFFTDNIVSSTIIHAMRLDNERATSSLSNFTSGRGYIYAAALEKIMQNPIIGTGVGKVDNLYLCILCEGGIIGAFFILLPWGVRIAKNIIIYKKNTNTTECILVLCLTAFYFIESLGESIPPYGPGVCSILFWICSGFVDQKYSRGLVKEKGIQCSRNLKREF